MTNFNEKLLKELSLQFKNLNNTVLDNYLKNLLLLEKKSYKNIHQILNNSELNDEKKQKKLEILAYNSKNYKLSNDFSLPNIIKPIVLKIDNYVFLELFNIKRFLPYQIIKNLSNKLKPDVVQNLSPMKKKALKFFITILRVFDYQEKSFGLFLCSTLLFFLRSRSLQKAQSKNVRDKICLSYENDKFLINRTLLISTLKSQLFEFFKVYKIVTQTQLLEKAMQIKSIQKNIIDKEEKKKLVESSLSEKESSFFSLLIEYESFEQSCHIEDFEKIQNEIGIVLLVFLEAVGLVEDYRELKKDVQSVKTFGLVQIPKQYVVPIFEIPCSLLFFPLVKKPNSWVKTVQNKNRNFGYGGFLYNKNLNTEGVSFQSNKQVKITLSDTEILALNYLQSNFYKINKNYLRLVQAYPEIFLWKYLKNQPGYEKFIKFYPGEICTVNDFKTFLQEDSDYIQLKNYLKLSNKMEEKKQQLEKQYFNLVNSLLEFIHVYLVADLYKNTKFYFSLFLDSRGRYYYHSSGKFGLQGSKFSQNLIELAGNNYKELITLPPTDEEFIEFSRKPENVSIKEFEPNFYSNIKKSFGINSSCVGLDACCSGGSILSGLVGFENGLMSTRVIKPKNKKLISETFPCLYSLFQRYLSSLANFHDIFTQEYLNKQSKIQKCSIEELTNILSFFISHLDEFLTRDNIKEFVICKNYGQQNKGRADYIYDFFILPSIMSHKQYKLKSKKNLLRSISFKFAEWVEKAYENFLPELHEFCTFVKTEIDFSQPLVLTAEKTGKFQIQKFLCKIVKIDKPSFQNSVKQKKHEINFQIKTKELDKKKTSRAAVANFIHFLDSRICSLVIHKCYLNKIILWTNHDCFYVHKNDTAAVKSFYFESFEQLILMEDTVWKFFSSNKVKDSNEIMKFINKINTRKKEILKKIEKKEYLPSESILS